MSNHKKRSGRIRVLYDNSLFLIAGAVAALVWANLRPENYEHFIHFPLPVIGEMDTDSEGHSKRLHEDHKDSAHEDKDDGHKDDAQQGDANDKDSHNEGAAKSDAADEHDDSHASGDAHAPHDHTEYTLHWLVNDLLMALFFAIAGKEVWESLLPGGDLSNMRKAATPLLATVGGIIGPAAVYLIGAQVTGQMDVLGRGWAIPCATDIAFSYLVARLIFGPGHPAIGFLLLLAIADDAAGLVILAVWYPTPGHPVQPMWLLLTLGAMMLGYSFRWARLTSHWWYLLIPGVISWYSFFKAGIHPALGLVPIIPTMPHAHTDLGIFAREELHREDTLNAFEHWWKDRVELILGLFGLVNAGVVFSNVGVGTWLVLLGLIVGKPFGITFFTWVAQRWLKLEIPTGMTYRHVFSLGMVAAIGFTVALFVSVAAFPVPPSAQGVQDSVKMGALMSFGAAILAFIIARALGIRPNQLAKEDSKAEKQAVEQHEECLA